MSGGETEGRKSCEEKELRHYIHVSNSHKEFKHYELHMCINKLK